jgi:putative oxidoreductase|tara:strand:+ start:228 stop:644 length:417 start_codon:yes stop_codon:yes gene_type:complete
MENRVKDLLDRIPEFCMSHWLLRIPLAIVFIQQGLMKIPVDIAEAESYGLSYLVWWFVAYGELLSGIGLLIGGVMMYSWWSWIGDLLTRFSGFVMGCIMTGVIWIGQPSSVWDVILYDNLHVLLWVGGLYFALRGQKV